MKKYWIIACLITSQMFGAQLIHQKLDSVISEKTIPFSLELRDINLSSVNAVELFYKGDLDGGYANVAMTQLGPGQYIVNLTPVLNDSSQFQYYFSVKLMDGTAYSLPEVFPQDNCFVADIKKSETDPRIKLLNPLNRSYIDDGEPVVMISYEDPYETLNLDSISLKFDGHDVTREANVYNHFTNYIPAVPISEESHKIEFSVKDTKGQEYSIQSNFTYQPKKPSLVDYKGNITTIVDLYSSDVTPSSRPASRFKNALEMNLKSGQINADVYDYETSEESSLTQKQSRRRITMYDDKGYVKLSVGDSSPVLLSQYTLNGINVDGMNLAMNLPGFMTFTYIKGDTQRAVLGDSNPSVNTNGTFGQKLTAYQLAMKLGAWDTAFTLMNVKDDMNTLASTTNWGTSKPQENIVAGWYNKINLNDDQTSYIKSDLAGSLYYGDTSTGDTTTVPTEAKKIIPDFILNSVPIRTSMQGGAAGMLEYGTPVWSRELYLKTYGRFALPGFKSLGNTSVKTDDLMGGGSMRLNLMRGALSFSGSYEKNQDQVMKLFDSSFGGNTTYGDDFKGMVNADLFGVANLGFNYNLNLKKNDSTQNVTMVDNQTQTDLLSLSNIRMEMGKFVGKLNTNYSIINYNDNVASNNSFDQTALGFAVDTEFEPVKARFSFSVSDKNNKGTTPNATSYMSYGVRLDYEYIPKIMTTYGSIAIQSGINNGNDSSKWLNTNKTTLAVGGIYKLPGKYMVFYDTKFYVDLTITAAGDKIAASNDKSKNYTEQTLIFKLTSTF